MSTEAELQAVGGSWRISGDLDFQTIPGLWRRVKHLLSYPELVLSLEGVRASNSAALVFLLEVIAEAGKQGTKLTLEAIPESVYDIAHMYNAIDLLPPDQSQL